MPLFYIILKKIGSPAWDENKWFKVDVEDTKEFGAEVSSR
jgi:hypothetical protein